MERLSYFLLLISAIGFVNCEEGKTDSKRDDRVFFGFYSSTTETMLFTSTVITVPTCYTIGAGSPTCNGRKRKRAVDALEILNAK